jgi:UDP-N-acetylmuramate--alanine ligase
MTLHEAKKIYMVGIKGVGMSQLAAILAVKNKIVIGSDTGESFTTDEILQKNSIRVDKGFLDTYITPDIDLVITTAAHKGLQNPQVLYAKSCNIPVITYAQALGELMSDYKNCISICGAHGKTTTTGLCAITAKSLRLDPTYIVGTASLMDEPSYGYGKSDVFIVESDEYVASYPDDLHPKLYYMNPTHIIATNIDFDHPDVYSSLEEIKDVFTDFFKKTLDKGGYLVFCSQDPILSEVTSKLPSKNKYSYGFSQTDRLYIHAIQYKNHKAFFSVTIDGKTVEDFSISLAGEKNVLNAGGVILLFYLLGIPLAAIKESLPNFKGSQRRFEKKFEANETVLYDDYGHHPKEIVATIKAAQTRYPHKRIIVIFQPHTFSRTQSLLADFAKALSEADISLVADIFASAREDAKSFSVTSADIQKSAKSQGFSNVFYTPDILKTLKEKMQKGDIIVTMGAGNIYTIQNGIIELIKSLN